MNLKITEELYGWTIKLLVSTKKNGHFETTYRQSHCYAGAVSRLYLLDSTQHESLERNMPQVVAVMLPAHLPSQSMDVWEKCAPNPGIGAHKISMTTNKEKFGKHQIEP